MEPLNAYITVSATSVHVKDYRLGVGALKDSLRKRAMESMDTTRILCELKNNVRLRSEFLWKEEALMDGGFEITLFAKFREVSLNDVFATSEGSRRLRDLIK